MYSSTVNLQNCFGRKAVQNTLKHICPNMYGVGGDVAVPYTMKMLLGHRTKKTVDFSLRCVTADAVISDDDFFYDVLKRMHYNADFQVIYYTGLTAKVTSMMEKTRTVLDAQSVVDFPWQRMPAIEVFFETSFGIKLLCYMDVEREDRVVIFTGAIQDTNKFSHVLAASIPRLLPKYFIEKPLTDFETEYLLSYINETDHIKTYRMMDQFVANMNLDSCNIDMYVKDFERNTLNDQLKSIRKEIHYLENESKQIMERYRNYRKRIQDATFQFCGVEDAMKNMTDVSNLETLFRTNKYITVLEKDSSDNVIHFICRTHFEYFDVEAFNGCMNNVNSFIYDYYSHCHGAFDSDHIHNRRTLLKALFNDDPEFKVRVAEAFKLHDNNVSVLYENDSDDFRIHEFFKDYYKNPHLEKFECWGDNVVHIEEYFDRKDYEGVVLQCLAATRNINWTDVIVDREFLKDLFSTDAKIIEHENQLMTPLEALAYLNEHGMQDTDPRFNDKEESENNN